jgi:hypothetical protein
MAEQPKAPPVDPKTAVAILAWLHDLCVKHNCRDARSVVNELLGAVQAEVADAAKAAAA